MNEFSLKQLEVFAAVAEQESFTKAAQVLYLTQSTVSTHVATLEETFQTTLFVREGRSVRLTTDGKKLYPYVKKILADCSILSKRLVTEEKEEPLTLGASTVPGQYILPELMASYLRNHPSCRYSLRKGDTADIHRYLLGGEIHIGFVGAKLELEAMEYYPVEEDTLVMVTPNNEHYRAMKEKNVEGRSLLKERLIAREEGSGTDREVQNYIARCGKDSAELNIVARVDDPETIKRMIAHGVGVSILSSLAVRTEEERGQLLTFPMDDQQLQRNIYLAVRRGTELNKSEQSFIKYVKNKKTDFAAHEK